MKGVKLTADEEKELPFSIKENDLRAEKGESNTDLREPKCKSWERLREHPVTLSEFKSPDLEEAHFSSEVTYRTARCWQPQEGREKW